jgi:hypothetical protein
MASGPARFLRLWDDVSWVPVTRGLYGMGGGAGAPDPSLPLGDGAGPALSGPYWPPLAVPWPSPLNPHPSGSSSYNLRLATMKAVLVAAVCLALAGEPPYNACMEANKGR